MEIDIFTLVMTFSLIAIALALSRYQNLHLEKDLLIGAFRAFLQLTIIGYILKFVFNADNIFFMGIMLIIMIIVASHNTSKKGKDIPNVFYIVTFSIALGTIITLAILIGFKVIDFEPREVIPVSGMIVGNAMVASALALNQIKREISYRKGEIRAALALGATSRQAAQLVIKSSIKSGLIPTIEGMKTIGLVQLPGMMTGAILAGADPIIAVKLQIMVAFMLTGSVAITCTLIILLTYKQFFTKDHQLKVLL